jgi:hypothetical protein
LGMISKASSEKAFSSMDSLYQIKHWQELKMIVTNRPQSSEKIIQNLNAENTKHTMALREESPKSSGWTSKNHWKWDISQIKALDDCTSRRADTIPSWSWRTSLAFVTDKFVSDYEKYFDSHSKINEQRWLKFYILQSSPQVRRWNPHGYLLATWCQDWWLLFLFISITYMRLVVVERDKIKDVNRGMGRHTKPCIRCSFLRNLKMTWKRSAEYTEQLYLEISRTRNFI